MNLRWLLPDDRENRETEEQEENMEDKGKFQKNVEIVSKALKEQAGVREPEEEAKSLYKKFIQT